MILTQTIADLGFPPAKVVGAVMFEIEGPTDRQGYGMGGIEGALEEANKYIEKKHGVDALLTNAKFERITATAHPSYGRVAIRVTGDLYLMTPEMMNFKDSKEKLAFRSLYNALLRKEAKQNARSK